MDRSLIVIALVTAFWLYGWHQDGKGYDRAMLHQSAASEKSLRDAAEESKAKIDALQAEVLIARQENETLDAQSADLSATVDGLRVKVAKLSSDASAINTALASRSDGIKSKTPAGMLAELLDRHTKELAEVGGYADRLRVAGLACEGAYGVLSGGVGNGIQ